MTFDDAFGVLDLLAQASDAFTTGRPANTALQAAAIAMTATTRAAAEAADGAIALTGLDSPAGVLEAVSVAGNAACAHAALADLTNLQTILARP